MTRMEEYQALRQALETVPEAMETVAERALAREKTCRKKKRVWGIPVGSLAACFALFLLLVNCFPPFAAACEGLPVLGELAEALRFDKSLRRAVENEYVQPLGLSQTANGITARMEYLIVDQKSVNLFFSFHSEDGCPLRARYSTDTTDCISLMNGIDLQKNDELQQITLMSVGDTLPDTLELTLFAYRDAIGSGEESEPAAEFHFTIEYDPSFTAKGETIPVGASFTLDGQTLLLDRAEIYPTHMRLILREAAENTANLRSLDFCLTDDQGGTYEAGAGSVVSMGTGENENCYLLESPWFQDGKHFTLHIRGAQFLTKGKEWVRVDLQAKTIEGLPGWRSAGRDPALYDTWQVSVRTDGMPKGTARRASLFGSEYHNEDGTIQGYTGRGYSGGDGGWEYVTLEDYPENVVYLKLSHDRTVLLPQSLDIPIN